MVRRNPDLIHEHLPHAVDALSRSIDGLNHRRAVEKLLDEEGAPAEIIEKVRSLDP